jgi:hypothetical protein
MKLRKLISELKRRHVFKATIALYEVEEINIRT